MTLFVISRLSALTGNIHLIRVPSGAEITTKLYDRKCLVTVYKCTVWIQSPCTWLGNLIRLYR